MTPPLGLGPWMPEPDAGVLPPPTAYPNLWQWLSPTAVVGSPNVTTWTDLGPQGHSDGTVSSSPAPQTGGSINGVAGIVYTSNAAFSRTIVSPASTTFANFTIFAVINPSALEAYRGVYDNNFNLSFLLGLNGTATAYQILMAGTIGTVQGGTPAIGTPVLLTAIFQNSGASGTAILQIDGITVASGSLPTPSSGSGAVVTFGGRTSSGMDPVAAIAGTYGDGAIYTDAKSGDDLLNLNRYFGRKYGIVVP